MKLNNVKNELIKMESENKLLLKKADSWRDSNLFNLANSKLIIINKLLNIINNEI